MRGVITFWDVMRNGPLVVREFGAPCFLRCLLATIRRQRTTFLEVAFGRREHP